MKKTIRIRIHRFLSVLRRDITGFPARICCLAFSIFPIKNNKIFVEYPYHRETIAVVDRLVSENKGYDIVLASGESRTPNTRNVKPDSIKYIYELATSCIWVDSRRKKRWVHKRKNQLYIQTWHGAVAMKKVEKDAEEVLPAFYIKSAQKDSSMVDYMVAETKMFRKTIQDAFWYNGKIIEGEFKDGALNVADKGKVCFELGTKENYNFVLYAPTFRANGDISCYDLDYQKAIEAFEEYFGGKWAFIIRLHPVISNKTNMIHYSERIINGTLFPRLGDLISISDVVMTDYSSCMFYGYRSMKPVFIYASDFDDYMQNDRGGYFKYEDMPASVAKTTDELINYIRTFDKKEYEDKVRSLNKSIGYYENDIMDQIVKIIDDHIKGK